MARVIFIICFSFLSMVLIAEDLYPKDEKIVETLKNLEAGHGLNLPKIKHLYEGKDVDGSGRNGPYARDYTNKMVYSAVRSTALYCGGNHGMGRTNDVWEYHLGSNTWICLFKADGGDHAKHKNMLMFMPRKWDKNLEHPLNEKEQKEFDDAKKWWNHNVVLKDGHYLTKNGGTLLHGHTWDTLVYDEASQKLIQGNGAHCAGSPILMHKFAGMPLDEVKAKLGKNLEGISYKPMWLFDPNEKKWIHYASNNDLANLRGMGASLCYIPDWKKTICYVSAQNVTPQAHAMKVYDGVADTWEELKPNGGKSIDHLSLKLKVAPESEPQLRYSQKHKKIIAVLKRKTYCYDLVKNEWSDLGAEIPFDADDAKTVFDYDQKADVFLLLSPRSGSFAFFDLKSNQWQKIESKGDQLKKPPYCVGKGYYDPTYNVFVVQSAYSTNMWVYRHAQ